MENSHTFLWSLAFKITTWSNPNHPLMAHLVACDYSKCSCKLEFHVILRIIHGNGSNFLA